jgi:hypothetical protein
MQNFLDHLEDRYVQTPLCASDRTLFNCTQPHVIQYLQQYDPHLRKAFLRAVKCKKRDTFMEPPPPSTPTPLSPSGTSWKAAVASNLRLTLRENQAFLKSAGPMLPPQGSSQSSQLFGNEDVSLLFRASHHASTRSPNPIKSTTEPL